MNNAAAQLTMLTRLGFAARGLLYLVIAYLVISTGRTEDPAGALDYLQQGGGKPVLYVVTIGLLAYGLWRLSDAAFDIERHGSDNKAVLKRLGAAASALIHFFLAWQAVKLIQGASTGGGNGASEGAGSVLQLPGGGMMLIVAGLILLATGVYQLAKAAKGSYLKHLEPRIAAQPWAKWTGRLGYAARGIVFLITGAFIANAGLGEQANEAGGMAEALSWLDSPWDMIVAFGLLAFGLFSLIEARYRVLHNVPVGDIGRHVRAKI
jgi:Domain of Unknown Function (DUF1206)